MGDVTNFLLVILTVALVVATWKQAQATKAMEKLQDKLNAAEIEPMLILRVVWLPYRLEISNLGKFGILITEVTEQGSTRLLSRAAFPLAIHSGKTEHVDLNLPTAPASPLPGQHLLTVRFLYGGQPNNPFTHTYALEHDPQTSAYTIKRIS